MDFILKMMDFILKMMDFVPKMQARSIALGHSPDGAWWRRVEMATLSRLRSALECENDIFCNVKREVVYQERKHLH